VPPRALLPHTEPFESSRRRKPERNDRLPNNDVVDDELGEEEGAKDARDPNVALVNRATSEAG
jgi:hypothetical protein